MTIQTKLAVIAAALALSACTSLTGTDTASINSTRSKNSMMVSKTQAEQQARQRAAELEEAAAKNAKNRMNMGTVREGLDTLREGIGVINYIKNVF